eukprot:TRINITY_DN3538_c0_g1_i1.p1 TRINITY_DN3538_c0_g1~~TRINITY_DN3538_c0_g1_i1.p1  ORF type:complete len:259 (+),score=91.67 TRINITY_DN3538_c0_g1_i1:80-856(+)
MQTDSFLKGEHELEEIKKKDKEPGEEEEGEEGEEGEEEEEEEEDEEEEEEEEEKEEEEDGEEDEDDLNKNMSTGELRRARLLALRRRKISDTEGERNELKKRQKANTKTKKIRKRKPKKVKFHFVSPFSSVSTPSLTSHEQETKKPSDAMIKSLAPFLNCNTELKNFDFASGGRFTGTTDDERRLKIALDEGDFEKAQELNDKIQTSESAHRLLLAIQSKKYFDDVNEGEREKSQKNKKKRLHWGFDSKERWERKGNM